MLTRLLIRGQREIREAFFMDELFFGKRHWIWGKRFFFFDPRIFTGSITRRTCSPLFSFVNCFGLFVYSNFAQLCSKNTHI